MRTRHTSLAHNTKGTRRSSSRRRRGFSLLEVIVAVTIVAILAAVIAPRLLHFIGTSKASKAKAESTSIANTVKLYLTENGASSLPDGFELLVLIEGPTPLLERKQDLIDPWGHEYVLRVPGEDGRDWDIISYGADGQPGGDGENADIVHGKT
jgi:general secretion pathway protein G